MSVDRFGGEVTYTRSAFTRAGFAGRGGPLLLDVGDGDQQAALKALQVAVAVCNEYMEPLEERDLWGRIDPPVLTPAGPMALMTECEPGRALTMMLDKLREVLALQHINGRLRPGKTQEHEFFDNVSLRALGALLFLPVPQAALLDSYDHSNRGPLKPEWTVQPHDTDAVARPLLDWVVANEGDVYVRVGATQLRLDADQAASFTLPLLSTEYMIRVKSVASERSMRSAMFSEWGAVSVSHFDLDLPRTDIYTGLRDLVRPLALSVQAGLIREITAQGGDRDTLGTRPPQAPILEAIGAGYWLTSHLEGDYVYDAYLAQILTTSQLAKTHDLAPARWHIEHLGHDRHLITHRDPDAWFDHDPTPLSKRADSRASPVPDDVLRQARADFGGAIMTADTLRAHPPALPAAEIEHVFKTYRL